MDTSGDEIDGKDEIICPHDINFANKVYISDDDFQSMFSRIPAGVNLEVIFDSCHSGTVTRLLPGGEEMTSRFLMPPLDIAFHRDYGPELPTKKQMAIVPGLNHVLWAGCRDNQTSTETDINGVRRGVFTYYFCEILRRCLGKLTRREIDRLLSGALAGHHYDQVPQLEASDPEMLQKPFQ